MNTELVLQKFTVLPNNLQSQVIDYIDFLINRYSFVSDTKKEELSPETKQLLNDCYSDYKKNPTKVKSWEVIEKEIAEKYQYEL